jgi:DNA polymerase
MVGTVTARKPNPIQESGLTELLAELHAEVKKCKACPAMKPFKKAPPRPGTVHTGYMLVGEAPGRGGSDLLERALKAVDAPGYEQLGDLFYLGDAVRCRPRRTPSKAECRKCRPFLAFEIRALRPKVIVALGARAAEAVIGKPLKIEEAHGKRVLIERDIEVLPLLMPSKGNAAALKRVGLSMEKYERWLTGLFGSLIDGLDSGH